MTDRISDIKNLRLQQETEFIDLEMVECLARVVTRDLVRWANKTIFEPINGKLMLEIPATSGPNARVVIYLDRPNEPQIEIQLAMLQEIYRDAFTFPLICKRIASETTAVADLNSCFPEQFTFGTGMPEIPSELMNGNLKSQCSEFLRLHSENPHSNLNENDILCRFLMFELMLSWVFFHELAHVVQQHFRLTSSASDSFSDCIDFWELEESEELHSAYVLAQGREILADIEGLNFTLQYMERHEILAVDSLYLLLCAQNCMFQRFYSAYEENLEVVAGKHPHPVIRDEYAHEFALNWMLDKCGYSREGKEGRAMAIQLAYISTRSSVMAGIFWAHRVEGFRGGNLPSFMSLQTKNFETAQNSYKSQLDDAIASQVLEIKNLHLYGHNCLYFFNSA